jgi:hypothetical protein
MNLDHRSEAFNGEKTKKSISTNETISTIEIPPDLEWDECDHSGTHLYATADIFGIQYHLDAIEVDESGRAIDKAHAERLKFCHGLDNGDPDDESPFSTAGLRSAPVTRRAPQRVRNSSASRTWSRLVRTIFAIGFITSKLGQSSSAGAGGSTRTVHPSSLIA